ncbi:MAG: beta/alpha barrel domain-containing protein, partial [Planctomycetota bacterium]
AGGGGLSGPAIHPIAVRMVHDVYRSVAKPAGVPLVGLERFLAEKLPAASAVGTVVIGSIAGNSIDDYREVAAAFDGQAHLPIVELNVSCPNTADGLVFGEDPGRLRELLGEVRPALANTRLLVKLSPNVGDIKAMAEAAIESGADGLTLINTVAAVAIDVESRGYRLSAGAGGGGLSGPAIHPIAVRMVHDVYRSVAKPAGVPLVGLEPSQPACRWWGWAAS